MNKSHPREKWIASMAPRVDDIWTQAWEDAKKAREQKLRVVMAMLQAAQPQEPRQEASK